GPSTPARWRAARMAAPPRSTAGRSLKAPPNLPIGVRAPATITDRAVAGPCYLRSATPKLMFPWSVVTLMALLGFALRSALHVLVKGPPVRLKCQTGSAFKFPVLVATIARASVGSGRVIETLLCRPASIFSALRPGASEPEKRMSPARDFTLAVPDTVTSSSWTVPGPPSLVEAVAQRDVTERCPLAAPDAKVAVQPANRQVAEARESRSVRAGTCTRSSALRLSGTMGLRELVSWTDTSFASWLMLTRAWLTAHPAAARVIELAECS